ncbi:Rit1 N-terminal domain [Fragilaria crotonensis]|nr:Rit1 N-terminal domain [Fragilaria crotonensis]
MTDVRNRLLSIQYDVEEHVKPVLQKLQQYPVVANERCGTWYAPRFLTSPRSRSTSSCYFKSTDGHVGTWNFSLKRLNLPIVNIVAKSQAGGCLILDSSVRKELPDSLSRTIPIWTCVMNRVVAKYRHDMQLPPLLDWDTTLYTPSWLVTEEEHVAICTLLDDRVESLYASGAIVNPRRLVETLVKPLRPYWITPDRGMDTEELLDIDDAYFAVICMSCSTLSSPIPETLDFDYIPGAGDDDESWARKLTPNLFWKNVDDILDAPDCIGAIDSIVAQNQSIDNYPHHHDDDDALCNESCYDAIGDTGICIGSRRAGRPPDCWNTFDAVLAVTDVEYDDMKEALPDGKYYLQLPVQEGKRDRSELERWLPVGIAFVTLHRNSRILIHCAQGRDRSVAIAMACITLLCDLKHPIQFVHNVEALTHASLRTLALGDAVDNDDPLFLHSGLSQGLVSALLGRPGRDCILTWLRNELHLPQDHDLATKETLRVALHLVQQYREMASPSRASMQKLNRFFMSSQYQM